ncbi:hypothetical protein X975_12894, partial [Stegodyphus mimosarum]
KKVLSQTRRNLIFQVLKNLEQERASRNLLFISLNYQAPGIHICQLLSACMWMANR